MTILTNKIWNPRSSHLILTSSGGTVVVSGNFNVLGNITQNGSALGAVTGSGDFFVTNALSVSGTIKNGVGHLILSSSAGSIVAVSGVMNFMSSSVWKNSAGSTTVKAYLHNNAVLAFKTEANGDATIAAKRYEDTGQVVTMAADEIGGRASTQVYWNSLTNAYSTGLREVVLLNGRYYAASKGRIAQSGTLMLSSSAPGESSGLTAFHSHLILSSSEGSTVVVSGNFNVLGTITENGSPIGGGGAASILSSSGNSIIASSGSIDFSEVNKDYHIRAVASHLVLSSSAGSRLVMSGSVHAKGGSGHGYIIDPNGDSRIDTGFDNQFLVYLGGTLYVQQSTTQYVVPTAVTSYEYRLNNAQLSVGASTNKQYSIRNDSGHLILSAAFGTPVNHVAVSGNLKVTLAVTSSDNVLVLGSSVFLGGNSSSEVVLRRSSNGLQVLKSDLSDYSFVQTGKFMLGGLSVVTSDVSNVVKFKNSSETVDMSMFPLLGKLSATNTHLILSSSAGSVVSISGTLKFGTHSAVGAETVSGYITILDDTGTSRKIAVVS
jgi:hypothetical protein